MCFNYPLVFNVSRKVARTHFINYCLLSSLGALMLALEGSGLRCKSICLGHHWSSCIEVFLSGDFRSPFIKYSPQVCWLIRFGITIDVFTRQGFALCTIVLESLPWLRPTRDYGFVLLQIVSARYSSCEAGCTFFTGGDII